MPAIARAVAALRVVGDDVNPDEVSRLLGRVPTAAHRKGDDIRKKPESPERLARTGMWRLEAKPTEPVNLNAQVSELLGSLSQDLSVWKALADKFKISVFCGWFMGGGNEGEDIAPETLRGLGERGIELSLDIYAPDA